MCIYYNASSFESIYDIMYYRRCPASANPGQLGLDAGLAGLMFNLLMHFCLKKIMFFCFSESNSQLLQIRFPASSQYNTHIIFIYVCIYIYIIHTHLDIGIHTHRMYNLESILAGKQLESQTFTKQNEKPKKSQREFRLKLRDCIVVGCQRVIGISHDIAINRDVTATNHWLNEVDMGL